jgi:hypothetical protein
VPECFLKAAGNSPFLSVPRVVIGKLFDVFFQRLVMWLREISDYMITNANEVCFTLALFISALFFRQYKKYETELEREEMIEKFLAS